MVSEARLEAMSGMHRAAVGICGCGRPLGHAGFCSERSKVREAKQAEREAACTTLCGCGKPSVHRGMCKARWAKRKENNGPSGNRPKEVFDFDRALVADRDRMMRLALSWTRDATQAQDLVSQAHINILSNRDKFEVGSNFPAWCTTIIKNLFLDSKRRQRNTVSLTQENGDGEEFEIVDPALTTAPEQESTIAAQEMARDVIAQTNPEQREALLRVAMHGQSLEEAADGMSVKVGTVKSLMSRGRDRLDPERKARVIPAVSRDNADAIDFVLQKLREERDRVAAAIVALEQCRTIFSRALG